MTETLNLKAKPESYQVFFGREYVTVDACSVEEAFLKAKMTKVYGPFRNVEEHERAAKEVKMTGKLYCPDNSKAIIDEMGLYSFMPGMMFAELFWHQTFSQMSSYSDEIGDVVDQALQKAKRKRKEI